MTAAAQPAAEPAQQSDADRKRDATLAATAALQGIALLRLADGRWLASRWNLCRELDDSEVEPWLARVGALR